MIIDDQLIPVVKHALETALLELPKLRGDQRRQLVREVVQRGLDVIEDRERELQEDRDTRFRNGI